MGLGFVPSERALCAFTQFRMEGVRPWSFEFPEALCIVKGLGFIIHKCL